MYNKNFENFIEKARSIHGYKYEYLEYKNMRTPIKLSLDGVIYHQNPSKHLMGRCPEKNTPKMTDENFILKSIEVWGNRFDYSKLKYTGALKSVILIDKLTGIEYKQRANSHLNGAEPFNKITIEDFIKDSIVIHDNKFRYDKSIYVNARTKLIITCPLHGDFKQSPCNHLSGNGCPRCNGSKGEKEIAKFLDKYNISYIRQHKWVDCKNVYQLPFDFYIPSMGIVIEFDGKQHFTQMKFFGGIEAYESLKINDKIKSNYCEENYINLIRIKYNQMDNIYQILWRNLSYHIKRLNLI